MAQQGSFRPLRAIAPRSLPDPPASGPPPEEGKIKRASMACSECKRRRTKCSADTSGIPCTECALHNRECVINELADRRRKASTQRTQDSLKYYKGFLERLIDAIRDTEPQAAEELVQVIRSGASHEEIYSAVVQALNQLPRGKGKKPNKKLKASPGGVLSEETPDGVMTDEIPDGVMPDGVSDGVLPDGTLDGESSTATPDGYL